MIRLLVQYTVRTVQAHQKGDPTVKQFPLVKDLSPSLFTIFSVRAFASHRKQIFNRSKKQKQKRQNRLFVMRFFVKAITICSAFAFTVAAPRGKFICGSGNGSQLSRCQYSSQLSHLFVF